MVMDFATDAFGYGDDDDNSNGDCNGMSNSNDGGNDIINEDVNRYDSGER